MPNQRNPLTFHSPVGPLIAQFIEEKRACGYKYCTESHLFRRLDRFLCAEGLNEPALPRDLLERWMAKQSHESATTHRLRIGMTRRLAMFVTCHGYPAYIPATHLLPRTRSNFVARIFTHDEVRRLLEAADHIRPDARTPLRAHIMPELFRLLYSCGLRISEALHLRVGDVDLAAGVLTIRQTKFGKDRFVPCTSTLTGRLRQYAHVVGQPSCDALFFPAPHGGAYHRLTIYNIFRECLWTCGIAHGGRGHGPRLHDLRHTFAVHRLMQWYREGVDLGAKLPVLATYMGHLNLSGTQRYLQLTAELFPELSSRLDTLYGNVIPRRTQT